MGGGPGPYGGGRYGGGKQEFYFYISELVRKS